MSTNLEKIGTIAIRPYSDPKQENMGLENYNYVVFPGTFQLESLAAIEQNGKARYLTGLNEFAPEVKGIKDTEKKKAVIAEIRKTVALLESERNFNHVKPEDADFWNKIEMFKPDNSAIWGKISLKLGNDDIYLKPKDNLDHLIIVKAIENGGFSMVASSFEEAKTKRLKWYLDKQIDTVAVKVGVTKLKNTALSLLQSLSEETPKKLFYIAKNLDKNSSQYTNKTLEGVVYDNLDRYINGLAFDKDLRRCAQSFIDFSNLSIEDLKLNCIIKDACFHRYIISKPDGMMYEASQNVMMGRSPSDLLEYLKNPTNQDMLDLLMEKVERLWAN
jgi:hypothetical protein